MDNYINHKTFGVLEKVVDKTLFKSLKILLVFNNKSIIWVTDEDEVYAFGSNGNECLGLQTTDHYIPRPKLIECLTGKNVVNICAGFGYCIALTRSGQCWSWGLNNYGQLGVGHMNQVSTPQLISRLDDRQVIKICATNCLVLALTRCGQVYGWGRNSFSVVSVGNVDHQCWPTPIIFDHPIRAVSGGKTHALALTTDGRVYTWGNNKSGQLGRPELSSNNISKRIHRPQILGALPVIQKAICGAEHTLLLTTDGDIYGFGCNTYGQVGTGKTDNQFTPIQVTKGINKFKDIVSNHSFDVSIGVSVDNEYYFWGNSKYNRILCPQRVANQTYKSAFDLFATYAKYRITYEAIVVEDGNDMTDDIVVHKSAEESTSDSIASEDNWWDYRKSQDLDSFKSDSIIYECDISAINDRHITNDMDVKSTDCKSCKSLNQTNVQQFESNLCQTFNNPEDYDIIFRFKDQLIYCHKTIIRIRNKTFWDNCMAHIDADGLVIRVKHYRYKSLSAFIQYLYTNSVDITDEIVDQLLTLANIYNERSLKRMCFEFKNQK